MNFTVISIGKVKDDCFKQAADEYVKRIGGFSKINFVEIPASALPPEPNAARIEAALEKEARLILPKTNGAYKIALTPEGKRVTSGEFALILEKAYHKAGTVCFITGSSHGLSEKVKDACDLALSLSDMTFPRRLAQIMLLEQLYRALTIQNNKKYHK